MFNEADNRFVPYVLFRGKAASLMRRSKQIISFYILTYVDMYTSVDMYTCVDMYTFVEMYTYLCRYIYLCIPTYLDGTMRRQG